MHSAEPDQFDVEHGWPGQVDCNVGLVTRHIGRTHRAVEVDQNIRERLLEFDEAGSEPECAKAFGDRYSDFAGKRVGDGIAGAHQVERSRFHAFDSRNNQRAFVRHQGAEADLDRELRAVLAQTI